MTGRVPEINQELFLSDQLGLCHPLARLLWLGMHLMAGDDGRIESRPHRIKAQLLPYDDIASIEDLLIDLECQGLITMEQGYDRVEYIELQPPHLMRIATHRIAEECRLTAESLVNAFVSVPTPHPGDAVKQIQPVDKPSQAPKKSSKGRGKNKGKGQGKSGGTPSGSLEWLEPDKAAMLRGWVAEGKSIEEIAELMGRPIGTVRHWKYHKPEFAALLKPETIQQPEPKREPEPETESQAEPVKEAPAPEPVPLIEPVIIQAVDVAGPPKREEPGYLKWLEPENAAKLKKWVGMRMQTKELARKMGITPQTLVQWKAMSNEFAALVTPPRGPSLRDALGIESNNDNT